MLLSQHLQISNKSTYFIEEKQPDLFTRSLVLSLVIHLLVLGTWSLFPKTPRFSITVGPTSMEIIVLNSPPDSGISGNTFFKPTVEKLPRRIVQDKQVNPQTEDQKTAQQMTDWTEFRPSQGAVVEARPLAYVNEPPRYPHLARKKGWEGTVVVKTKVEKNGIPSEIQVEQSSGHGILDDSALKAVRGWKFLPAQSGVLKFASWIRIPW